MERDASRIASHLDEDTVLIYQPPQTLYEHMMPPHDQRPSRVTGGDDT